MSSFKLPSRHSLRGIWRPLPCITARERRLRWIIRVAVVCLLLAAAVMVTMLLLLPQRVAVVAIGLAPLMWMSGVGIAVCAVKLSEAHMDGKKAGIASRWKVCPACEYDLATLDDTGHCPECGDAYDAEELAKIWAEVYQRLEEKPGQ